MHHTKKENQRHYVMKAHIEKDAESGLVHTVRATAANEADVEQVADLVHDKVDAAWADSGYRGAQARVTRCVQWHIAGRPSDMAKMPDGRAKTRARKSEYEMASVRANVAYPFRVIKRQFGFVKIELRGLARNTAHLIHAVFAVQSVNGAQETDGDVVAERPSLKVRTPHSDYILVIHV